MKHKHKHHGLFEAAAKGEAEQFEAKHRTWIAFEEVAAYLVSIHYAPTEWTVRRKQRTHTVNGWEVPAPMTEAPEIGSAYWTEDSGTSAWAFPVAWSERAYDQRVLSRGICHATEQGAIQNCKARHGVDPFAEGEEA